MATTTPDLAALATGLGYLGAPGWADSETEPHTVGGRVAWNDLHRRLNVDAAYFSGDSPLVVFRDFRQRPNGQLSQLHKSLWNANEAPLLLAIGAGDVDVVDCFRPPDGAGRRPKWLVQSSVPIRTAARHLAGFTRNSVDTGGLWQHPRAFRENGRVDRRLLDSLRRVLRELSYGSASRRTAVNRLVASAIFLRYLEDRAPDFLRGIVPEPTIDVLAAGQARSEQMLRSVAQRLNGDVFAVGHIGRSQFTDDEDLTDYDYQRVAGFLRGDDWKTGQQSLFPFEFQYIPIQLVGSVYEQVVMERRRERAAYYTPLNIVSLLLDHLLPWDQSNEPSVLDPACGSGAFLVEAFRRIVRRKCIANGRDYLPPGHLLRILLNCIAGSDIDGDAIDVTVLSLCLALFDLTDPNEWPTLRLPRLRDVTLHEGSFIDPTMPVRQSNYDLVVGNPPWASALSEEEEDVLRDRDIEVGDRQLAQAFLRDCGSLLKPDGHAALLVSSKSILHNRSGPNTEFRRAFFADYDIDRIVELAPFRGSLFRDAPSPAALVVFGPRATAANGKDVVSFAAPLPTPYAAPTVRIELPDNEQVELPSAVAAANPELWKIATWGSPRDYRLIQQMRRTFPTLHALIGQLGWTHGEGAVRGRLAERKAPVAEYGRYPLIDPTALHPLHIDEALAQVASPTDWQWPRDPRLFRRGSRLLIRGGVQGRPRPRIAAAYREAAGVYTHAYVGVVGKTSRDVSHLKLIAGCLSSRLCAYYLFLTSSVWAVYRYDVNSAEVLAFPVPGRDALDSDPARKILRIVDEAAVHGADVELLTRLDIEVMRLYDLVPYEQDLVNDFTEAVIVPAHTFRSALATTTAFRRPHRDELDAYAAALVEVLRNTTRLESRTTMATDDDSAMIHATILLKPAGVGRLHFGEVDEQQVMRRFDDASRQATGRSLFERGAVHVLDRDRVHIFKRGEWRMWTASAARNDADRIVKDLLTAGHHRS